MPHPLDRPVWNALDTGWVAFAKGDRRARRLGRGFGVFGAAADRSTASLAALGALVPGQGELWLIERAPWPAPPGTRVARIAEVVQMIAEAPTPGPPAGFDMTDLTEDDAAAMHDLAALTQPGPYGAHSNRLGHFVGVTLDGGLVAMAGERMAMPGLREVSGVCTHPDFRGRGYAKGLMRVVAERMIARGETPFLHAYAGNSDAIRLYQSLGFRYRATMTATVLVRDI